jgi:hypothetical protein
LRVLFSRSRSVILYDVTNSLLLTDRILADLRSNNGSLSDSDSSEPKETSTASASSNSKSHASAENRERREIENTRPHSSCAR